MARKTNKICISCNQTFRGRRDARTCSERCRKRAQRAKNLLTSEVGQIKQSAEKIFSGIESEIRPVFVTEGGFVGDVSTNPSAGSIANEPEAIPPSSIPLNAPDGSFVPDANTSSQPNQGQFPQTFTEANLARPAATINSVTENTPAASVAPAAVPMNNFGLSLEQPKQPEEPAQTTISTTSPVKARLPKSMKLAGGLFSVAVLFVAGFYLLFANKPGQQAYNTAQINNIPSQEV